MTVLIQSPSLGQRLFHLVVHLQLAAGDYSGGSIEEEVIGLCGEGAGDGVGAQHSLAAEGGNHDGLGVGAAEAHQAFLAGHLGVVAGDAVVVGITDGNDADTGNLCLGNGHFHSLIGN